MQQLHEKVYRRWFASRAEDTDISHQAFFCRPLEIRAEQDSAAPPSIKKVFEYHQSLCKRLDALAPELSPDPPRDWYITAERAMHLPQATYKLRPTFNKCFIVMQCEWQEHSVDSPKLKEHGVTIVWTREEDAIRHGCVVDPERGISAMDIEGQGEARAFRCQTLQCAMALVLAAEPQRNEVRSEGHGRYNNPLDQSDTADFELCRCSGCKPDLHTDFCAPL